MKKFQDYTNLYTSCLTIFSSNWNNAANAGTFQLNVNNTFSLSNTNVTCHLLFSNRIVILYGDFTTLPLDKI